MKEAKAFTCRTLSDAARLPISAFKKFSFFFFDIIFIPLLVERIEEDLLQRRVRHTEGGSLVAAFAK